MIFNVHVAIQANLEPAPEPAGSPRGEQRCSSSSTRTCFSISPIPLPSQVLGLAHLTEVVAVGNRNSTPCPSKLDAVQSLVVELCLISGDRAWPESREGLAVPLSLSTLGRMLPHAHLSPLLWLWLPPDVTALHVTACLPLPSSYHTVLFSCKSWRISHIP